MTDPYFLLRLTPEQLDTLAYMATEVRDALLRWDETLTDEERTDPAYMADLAELKEKYDDAVAVIAEVETIIRIDAEAFADADAEPGDAGVIDV